MVRWLSSVTTTTFLFLVSVDPAVSFFLVRFCVLKSASVCTVGFVNLLVFLFGWLALAVQFLAPVLILILQDLFRVWQYKRDNSLLDFLPVIRFLPSSSSVSVYFSAVSWLSNIFDNDIFSFFVLLLLRTNSISCWFLDDDTLFRKNHPMPLIAKSFGFLDFC